MILACRNGDARSSRDGGDQYTGLDRFGRVIEQRWQTPDGDFERLQYTYDADGNVLYRKNLVKDAFSELYHDYKAVASSASPTAKLAYDRLNRLTAFYRGLLIHIGPGDRLNDTRDGSALRFMAWTLDVLGNNKKLEQSYRGDPSRTATKPLGQDFDLQNVPKASPSPVDGEGKTTILTTPTAV